MVNSHIRILEIGSIVVKFQALMKKLEVKNLVSGDKGARLVLDLNIYNDNLIAELNKLMQPESEVEVIIKAVKN